MTIKTECNEVPPSWSDCCGTHGFTEWRVWVDGVLIIDEIGTGGTCFDDEAHAIECATGQLGEYPEPRHRPAGERY
jgi:hypothetical protein